MAHPILDEAVLASWLETHTEWRVEGGALCRSLLFEDFKEAFAWMTRLAEVAEAMGHHPEWLNVYARVDVRLTTHDSGGLTLLDLKLAEEMERALPS